MNPAIDEADTSMSFSDMMNISPEEKNSPFSPDARNFLPGCREERLSQFRILAAGYRPRMENWSYPDVFSPFWRIYANTRRGSWLRVDENEFPLEPDHLLLVPSHRNDEGHG